MSALTGEGADALLPQALALYQAWNLRVGRDAGAARGAGAAPASSAPSTGRCPGALLPLAGRQGTRARGCCRPVPPRPRFAHPASGRPAPPAHATQVPTSKLNRWIEQVGGQYTSGGGSEVRRVRFLSQVCRRSGGGGLWGLVQRGTPGMQAVQQEPSLRTHSAAAAAAPAPGQGAAADVCGLGGWLRAAAHARAALPAQPHPQALGLWRGAAAAAGAVPAAGTGAAARARAAAVARLDPRRPGGPGGEAAAARFGRGQHVRAVQHVRDTDALRQRVPAAGLGAHGVVPRPGRGGLALPAAAPAPPCHTAAHTRNMPLSVEGARVACHTGRGRRGEMPERRRRQLCGRESAEK